MLSFKQTNNNKGQILVITLIIMFVLSLIALSAAIGISRDTQQRVFNEVYDENYFQAEARILQAAEGVSETTTVAEILDKFNDETFKPLNALAQNFDSLCSQSGTDSISCEISEDCIETDLNFQLTNNIQGIDMGSSDAVQIDLTNSDGSFYTGPVNVEWTGNVTWSIGLVYLNEYYDEYGGKFESIYEIDKGTFTGASSNGTGFTFTNTSGTSFTLNDLVSDAGITVTPQVGPTSPGPQLEVNQGSCENIPVNGTDTTTVITCPGNKVMKGLGRYTPGNRIFMRCCDATYGGQNIQKGSCSATPFVAGRDATCPANTILSGMTRHAVGTVPTSLNCCSYTTSNGNVNLSNQGYVANTLGPNYAAGTNSQFQMCDDNNVIGGLGDTLVADGYADKMICRGTDTFPIKVVAAGDFLGVYSNEALNHLNGMSGITLTSYVNNPNGFLASDPRNADILIYYEYAGAIQNENKVLEYLNSGKPVIWMTDGLSNLGGSSVFLNKFGITASYDLFNAITNVSQTADTVGPLGGLSQMYLTTVSKLAYVGGGQYDQPFKCQYNVVHAVAGAQYQNYCVYALSGSNLAVISSAGANGRTDLPTAQAISRALYRDLIPYMAGNSQSNEEKLVAIRLRPIVLDGSESTNVTISMDSSFSSQFAEILAQSSNTCVGDTSPTPLLSLKMPLIDAPPALYDYVYYEK